MIVTAAMNNQTIVDSRGPEGVTPLVLACQYGHLDTINTLLELVRAPSQPAAWPCLPVPRVLTPATRPYRCPGRRAPT